MSNMRHRSSRNNNNRTRNSRNNGGRRNHNPNNVVNLSAAKSNYEKYLEKAKDAKTSGDRVLAENFFQYADHYKRILIEADEKKGSQQKKQAVENNSEQPKAPDEPQATDKKEESDSDSSSGGSNIPKEFSL